MQERVDTEDGTGGVSRSGRARWVLAGSMLIMGACGIMYEYALGSLGNNLMGSSHEQIFVVIGIMMFAMGVGAELQRRFDHHLVDTFLIAEVLLGVAGGVSVLATYTAFVYWANYQIVLFTFAFGIGCLIGLEVPLLIRINQRYAPDLRANLGNILSMDYVGSLIGALIFAYVLITRVGIDRIGVGLGLANCLVAAGGAWFFRPHLHRPGRFLLILVAGIALLLALGLFGPRIMADLEQRTYADPIVHRSTSPYQHVVLTQRDDRLRMFINGQLQFDSRDEHIYHEFLVHPAMSLVDDPRQVLILGGGDGLAAREILRYPTVERIDLVDLDPLITRLAREQERLVALNDGALNQAAVTVTSGAGLSPGPPLTIGRERSGPTGGDPAEVIDTARVRLFHLDAHLFVRQVAEAARYDVVIIDFPDPHHLELAKLYSLEFFRHLRRHLRPGGLIAIQSTSPYHARQAFLCIGKTMRAAGFAAVPYHANVPSFGDWGWHLATRGGDIEAADLRRRLQKLTISAVTRHLTPTTVAAATAFGKGALDDEDIVINTTFRPVIVDYYRHAWRR